MKRYRFDPTVARPVTQYGSSGLSIALVARLEGEAVAHCMRLAPGGEVGRHQAVMDQLFLVVAGEGWVEGEVRRREPIGPGEAAFWAAGEEHAAGTDTGLTAIVIEGAGIDPPGMKAAWAWKEKES